MKKNSIVLVGFLVYFGSLTAQAQDIYMKITPYSGNVITAGLGPSASALDNGKEIKLSDYVKVSSIQYDFEQTLSISSQSTGAGAGKITFNPLTITKIVDQTSGPLFQAMARGEAFQGIEFIFVVNTGNALAGQVLYKILLKLAAVRNMSVSSVACSSGCPGIAESVNFEYGGYVVYTYSQKPNGEGLASKPVGWNRIKNIADATTDPIK